MTTNKSAAKDAGAGVGTRLTPALAIVSLIIFGGSYITNAMDRQVFSVLLPGVRESYGFDLAQGGLLSTVFALGIGIAGIPGAYLLDRYSRKAVVVLGIVIYSVFTALTALSFGFGDMLVYRALSGVGEAIQNTALFAAVGAYFFKHRALAIGTLNFAYGVGAYLGPRLGAELSLTMGGWRAPLYVFGALGLVFVVLILLFVSKRFTEQVEAEGGSAATNYDYMPWKLYNRNVILLAISGAVTGLSGYGYLGLYPTFLQSELQFSVVEAGTAIGMFGLGALMGIPAGLLGDRVNQRWILITSAVAMGIIGYLIFNGPTTPLSQNFLSFLMGTVSSGLMFTNTYSAIQRSVRPDLVGRVSGIFVTSWYLPSAIAGYLFASLKEGFGWGGASMIQLSLLPLIGIVALAFLNMNQLTTSSSRKSESVH